MIDNWRIFSADWNSPSEDLSEATNRQQDFYRQQTMVALLCAQQAAGSEMKSRRGITACRQFVADIKTSAWHHSAISMRFTERATGFDYEYLSHSRICFKGNLTTVWDLAPPGFLPIAKHKIDQCLATRKLTQFKELFPDLTHLWICLNALVIAHFFHRGGVIGDGALQRGEPLLKHHKVQFDQEAIAIAFAQRSDIPDLEYRVHKLSVGRYCSYTLSLQAGESTLMNVSLGIYRSIEPSALTRLNAVDIVIG